MNGKKFTLYFVGAIVLIGGLGSYWIKHSYDNRPIIPITESK